MKTLSAKKCLLIISLYFFSFFFAGNIFNSLLKDRLLPIYQESVLDAVLALFFYFIVKDELRGELNIFKAELTDNIKYIFKKTGLMWAICEVISLIVAIIFMLVFNLEPQNNANSEAIFKLLSDNFLIVTTLSVIFAPFLEEILFRGALFKIFSKISKEFAVLAVSLLFALLHFMPDFLASAINPSLVPSLIAYLVLSYIITFYYYKHHNIFISMGIHGLYNLINILLALLVI